MHISRPKWLLRIVALATLAVSVTLFFPLGLDCGLPHVPALAGARNAFEIAQQQTVLIVRPDGGQGSGVIIKRKNWLGKTRLFVFTASHVVEGVDKVNIVRYIRNEGRKVGVTVYKASVLDRSTKAEDVAVLWLDAPADEFIGAEFDRSALHVGAALFHCGNFFGGDFDNSISKGSLSQIGVQPRMEGWPWGVADQYAGAAVPGSSGGPIFNARNGKVVGLVVGGLGRGAYGFLCFIPTRVIEQWSAEHGMRWLVEGGRCPTDKMLHERADLTASTKPELTNDVEPN